MTKRPILLLQGNYYGTLTAVRAFGEAGHPVRVADTGKFAPALFSHWIQKTERCPHLNDENRFVDWLLEYGAARPGTFLYPSSDDACYLIAKNREALHSHFLLLSPTLPTLMTLLDKARLHKALLELKLPVLPTEFPRNAQEAHERQSTYPCLLKPRTQILQRTGVKGAIVSQAQDLNQAFVQLKSQIRLAPSVLAFDPTLDTPMVQQYIATAPDSIVSVAGMFDNQMGLNVRFARKVLQRPRRLGIGLCFEAIAPIQSLCEQLERLCRHINYEGVFEAEFVQTAAHAPFWLMDFNPRFYSQMAMEVSRELNLPLLILDFAERRSGNVHPTPSKSVPPRSDLPTGKDRYTHSLILSIFILGQSVSGRMKRSEIARWIGWLTDRRRLTDAVWSWTDPIPGIVDAIQFFLHAARYPRGFIRKFFGES